ncbi:ABC transporter ATP-binding protein/permease [bacterium]|nr:ABC transporter ATP-binding protein/permease [bacterium]
MFNDHKKILNIFKYFVTNFKSYLLVFSLVLIFEIIIGLFLILSIAPMADYLLDNTLANPNRITKIFLSLLNNFNIQPSFWSLSIFFVISNFIKAAIDIFTRYISYKIKYDVYEKISSETLEAVLNANWNFFNKSNHGKLLNSLQKESGNISDTLSQMCYQISFCVQLILYLSIPLWLNTEMTLIAIVFATIFISPFLLTNKISFNLGKKNTVTANIMVDKLSEILFNCKLIISHNMQSNSVKEYKKSIQDHTKASIKSQLFINSCATFYQPFSYLATIIAVGYGISESVSLTETTSVLWALMRAMPLLSKMLQSNLNISSLIPSFEQLNKINNDAKQTYVKNDGIILKKILHNITFKNINFSFSSDKKHFSNLSFSIQANKINALVGHSGSGKTTIIDLILGLYKQDSGDILFDNNTNDNINIKKFRNIVGYVPQEPMLFNGSIRENLIWLNRNITETDLMKACKTANILEFIKQLPNGFETKVGDIGGNLSGGQKQRLTIARALIRKPSLLIFDEATSALDIESENLIIDSFKQISQKCTILTIAHRIKTLKQANSILVLKKGKVMGQDTFDKLIKTKNKTFLKLLNYDT